MLTIGAFSRLSRVSARMLRHYDLMGLLRPVRVGDENGYRYYDLSQLTTLRQIETLKGYGFSLAEIRTLLPLPQEELTQKIHERRLEAYEELSELRKTLRRMEEEIMKMEGTGLALEKYHVIVMDAPEQRVFSIRRTINISETNALFADLLEEAAKRGYKRTGPTQQRFMGEEYNYDALDLEAQVQVAGEGEGISVIPEGSFVSTIHIGPYESVHYAYEAIADYLAKHPEYEVSGPSIERYLKDEGMVHSPEELETGILFPVKKK